MLRRNIDTGAVSHRTHHRSRRLQISNARLVLHSLCFATIADAWSWHGLFTWRSLSSCRRCRWAWRARWVVIEDALASVRIDDLNSSTFLFCWWSSLWVRGSRLRCWIHWRWHHLRVHLQWSIWILARRCGLCHRCRRNTLWCLTLLTVLRNLSVCRRCVIVLIEVIRSGRHCVAVRWSIDHICHLWHLYWHPLYPLISHHLSSLTLSLRTILRTRIARWNTGWRRRCHARLCDLHILCCSLRRSWGCKYLGQWLTYNIAVDELTCLLLLGRGWRCCRLWHWR